MTDANHPAGHDPLANVSGRVDTKLESDGEWFEHAPVTAAKVGRNQIDGSRQHLLDANGNGLRRLFVRSSHTRAFKNAERKIRIRALRMYPDERLEFEEVSRHQLVAEHCLGDWDFTDANGQVIPFTPELAERVMTEPDFRHHRDFALVCVATLQGDIARAAEDDSRD